MLDADQLSRIEHTHRGFLYQHLVSVGCLLQASGTDVVAIVAERDEDVEVVGPTWRVYAQVRTRSHPLYPSDVADALARFDALRDEHSRSRRSGTAAFWIISNVEPGPLLVAQMEEATWPVDIHVWYPGCPGRPPVWMPPAWPSLSEAISGCTALASRLPYTAIAPSTLVLKLAALVASASTGVGYPDHRIETSDLPALFEQFVASMQAFPRPPTSYRPLDDEPEYTSDERIRLLVGLSGSGKTTWASQAAVHVVGTAVFYDVGQLPSAAFSSSLARELAARLFSSGTTELRTIFQPGSTGLESLRAIDIFASRMTPLTIFVDNVHHLSSNDLRIAVEAMPATQWVLLGQPWAGQAEIEAHLSARTIALKGWDPSVIGAQLAADGCPVDPATSVRLHRITGGLPLFINNTALIANHDYEGNVRAFVDDLVQGTHSTSTVQETILAKIIDSAPIGVRLVCALLSVSDRPLPLQLWLEVLSRATQETATQIAASIRQLKKLGVVEQLGRGEVKLHDAFLELARERVNASHQIVAGIVRLELAKSLEALFAGGVDPVRYGLYVRLLAMTGQVAKLADIVPDRAELVKEQGLAPEVRGAIAVSLATDELLPEDRFWLLDILAYWDFQDGDHASCSQYLDQMEQEGVIEPRAKATLLEKRAMIHAWAGDGPRALALFAQAKMINPSDDLVARISRYNMAAAIFKLGQFAVAEREAIALVEYYTKQMNLTSADFLGVNLPEFANTLASKKLFTDDLKRLADCLSLLAMALAKQQKFPNLIRIWAHKLYAVLEATGSAIRTGQEVVDDMLQLLGDPGAARQFLEQSVLPYVRDLHLAEHLIPVRAQYAVVLAHCGSFDAARKELSALAAFRAQMGHEQAAEFDRQVRLVEDIATGNVRLRKPTRSPIFPSQRPVNTRPVTTAPKIGRNTPCPCGSEKKYKKCHGAAKRE